MKTRSSSLLAVCVAAALVVLLAGCPFPKASAKSASLTISIKDSINTRTLLPPLSMDAASYSVDGAGPNGATFSQSTSGEPVTVEGLTFGTWTVTVNALNADGTLIGQGQAVATVSVGQDTTLSVTVTPLGGTGDLNLSVTWTASLQYPSIQASLVPPTGSATSLDFGISGTQASYSGSTIAAGYYTLTLQLLENNIPVMGAVEVVRIVSGQTTSGTYDFSNVNMGTIEVNITPAMANPIPVDISGVPSTVAAGTSVTATASVSDGTANVVYVWYLNGVSQAATGPSYTFGSNLHRGYYRLDVTAFTADGLRAGSATAGFQVGASIPSIAGSWNSFRAWFKNIPVIQFAADGTFIGWEDYAETIENNNGTWSLTGNTFTETFSHGGPGAGVSFSGTMTWVNVNQAQFSMSGSPATFSSYRKGFEPDGYLFNNPKYPPIALVRDTPAQGNLPSDGLALYEYVAGPHAQNTVFSLTGGVQLYMYESDEQTFVDRIHKSTENEALTPYQTYYFAAIPGPLVSGDYSILVTEVPAYVGAWINPAYNGGDGGPTDAPAKIVMTATLFEFYGNDTDTIPRGTMSFDLAGDWTDAGCHYFQGEGAVSGSSTRGYFLIGVSDNNFKLRITSSASDYPTSLDTSLEYWRQ